MSFLLQLNFCKIEIRHTLKRENLLSCFSFSNINYLIDNYLALLFKEIKKRISLNNMCLISILHNSCYNTETDRFIVSFLRKQESINVSLEWIPACAGMTKCDMSLLNTCLRQCVVLETEV